MQCQYIMLVQVQRIYMHWFNHVGGEKTSLLSRGRGTRLLAGGIVIVILWREHKTRHD